MSREVVNTGGAVSFSYPRDYVPKRDKELENRIDLAYHRYYLKKIKNKIALIIILLIILLFLFFWKVL